MSRKMPEYVLEEFPSPYNSLPNIANKSMPRGQMGKRTRRWVWLACAIGFFCRGPSPSSLMGRPAVAVGLAFQLWVMNHHTTSYKLVASRAESWYIPRLIVCTCEVLTRVKLPTKSCLELFWKFLHKLYIYYYSLEGECWSIKIQISIFSTFLQSKLFDTLYRFRFADRQFFVFTL